MTSDPCGQRGVEFVTFRTSVLHAMNTKPTAKVSIAVGADLFLSRPVPPDQVQQLQRLMSGMINECLDDIVEVMVGQGVLKPVKKT